MKKLLFLLLVSLILLSGCSSGLYNLASFVLPNDSEFTALIEELDTPKKICDYMINNFTYEAHLDTSLNPYQLYLIQKGDCDEFANFAIYMANYHGHKTYQIRIYYKDIIYKHILAAYKEEKYSFSSNQYYFPARHDNFLEIVKYHSYFNDNIWSRYEVYNYDNTLIDSGTN